MLTARIQVIDGTGTCTPLDSQPCRLLPSRHHRRPASLPWPTADRAERCQVSCANQIYDARLALNDRLGYAVNCFMSCLLGTIPKRSRLEVSLKDRLQDELKRTLHHPITDRGNRKDADFAPVMACRCAVPVRP